MFFFLLASLASGDMMCRINLGNAWRDGEGSKSVLGQLSSAATVCGCVPFVASGVCGEGLFVILLGLVMLEAPWASLNLSRLRHLRRLEVRY
jgi:hypothetical protein